MKFRSMNFKINLIIVIVATSILTAFGIFRYEKNRIMLLDQLEETLKVDLAQLSISLQVPLYNIDETTRTNLLEAIMQKKHVAGVFVWEEGKEKPSGFYRKNQQVEKTDNLPAVSDEIFFDEREIVYNKTVLGKVRLYQTKYYINESIRAFLISIIIQILFIDIILVSIMMILFKKIFLSPVKTLTDASIEISSGNLEKSIDIHSREDEIGILAKNFIQMKDSIRDYIKELKDARDNLELKVQQRTAELKEANEKLEKLATIDGLTGVANHRRFLEFYKLEWKRAIRNSRPISLILMDVDFFKMYNDTYGHQAGDECLRKIAQAIENSVKRETDLVARYGGEEFVAVLVETDAKGAETVAEKVSVELEKLKMVHEESSVSEHVTISMGLATTIPKVDTDDSWLINKADNALYQSKKNGRNRITVA